MATNMFKSNPFAFLSKILLFVTCGKLNVHRKASNSNDASQSWFHRHPFTPVLHPDPDQQELSSSKTLMFHVEGALLKSPSIFPYFMLVAFEAGGLLRALVLLLLYPLICLVGKDLALNIMVFVSFVGIKAKSYRVGTAVLPKFFLEDVGHEGFDFLMRYRRKVALSDLPKVMIDGFLRRYVDIEEIVGRELKVVCGYFVGLMEARKPCNVIFSELFGKDKVGTDVVGFGCFNKSLDRQFFSLCKTVFLVSEAEKRNWNILARKKYPKPMIFHDGRLAFRPTPAATLAMFIWIPFGLILFLIRFITGRTFPYKLSIPILSFVGMRGTVSKPKSFNPQLSSGGKSKGVLYVCNHKTLFDPIFASLAIVKPLTAVTYSLSKVSELVAPIKTIRLTRDRQKDSEIIRDLLRQDDLVLCPEGTTCREPYLLRFSPLFAEVSDEIVPMAIDLKVSMFYATTASGHKSLDPVLLLMNPFVTCTFKILDRLPESLTCGGGGKSKFDVANHVQEQIGKALNFECTSLTRKDKYMLLAGNEGKI